METQTNLNSQTINPIVDQTNPVTPKPSYFNKKILSLSIFIIFLFGLGIFVKSLKPQPIPSPTPLAVIKPTPTSDLTANWKTYTNTKYGYSFKYPSSFFVREETTGGILYVDLKDSSGSEFRFESSSGPNGWFEHFKSKSEENINGLLWVVVPKSTYCDAGNCGPTASGYYIKANTFYIAVSDFSKESSSSIMLNQILSTFKFLDQNQTDISNWKTYTSKDINVSFNYPSNFAVYEQYVDPARIGYSGISIQLNQTGGMSGRSMSITRSDKTSLWDNGLYDIKIGQTYSRNDKIDSKLTRISDKQIGNTVWRVFEDKNPWEMPGPIWILIVPRNGLYYRITMTYSNSVDNNPDDSENGINFTQVFDQILSTLKFAE